MGQSAKMKAALRAYVIAPLLNDGFVGKYPHYRKVYDDRIELFTVQTNKWGNSFTVEVSTVFPLREGSGKNFDVSYGVPLEEINVWHTNKRYRLKGMFDGWFYYTDVYARGLFSKEYTAVSEAQAASYVPEKRARLVQKADDSLYREICDQVNRQMKAAYKWWRDLSR